MLIYFQGNKVDPNHKVPSVRKTINHVTVYKAHTPNKPPTNYLNQVFSLTKTDT